MEEDRKNEYPLFKTPKGKTVEVCPDGYSGLWIINPHGVNTPSNLKNVKFTSAALASEAVQKWLDSLEKKSNG